MKTNILINKLSFKKSICPIEIAIKNINKIEANT